MMRAATEPRLSSNQSGPIRRRGLMLILSSPSGAGKTTLTRDLLSDRALDLTLSISVTTRPRRSSEVNGIHYNFVSRADFDAALIGLRAYARAEGLVIGVADLTDIDAATADAAWAFVQRLPRERGD